MKSKLYVLSSVLCASRRQTTAVWAGLSPSAAKRHLKRLPRKVQKAFANECRSFVHDGTRIHFVLFPHTKAYGLGIRVKTRGSGHPFKVSKFVSDCGVAKAKFVQVLRALGTNVEKDAKMFFI